MPINNATQNVISFNEMLGNLPNVSSSIKQSNEVSTIPVDEMYNYGGSKLGYVTRYSKGYTPGLNNEEIYAQRQTGSDKFFNATGQFWALTKNSFANHFKSYGREFDALTSANWDKLWNDNFGQESADLIRTSQNLYPIFETNKQQARRDKQTSGFFESAASSISQFVPFTGRAGNAWANLAGQLGFTAGMIGGVVTETGLLYGATALTGGAAAPLTAAQTVANANKVSRIKSMWNFIADTRGLTQIPEAAKTTSTFARIISSKPVQYQRLFLAAAGEASIEASTGKDDFKREQIQKYIDKYGAQPNQEWLNKLETESNKVGNNIFNWNLPILMVSDALTIGALFKPGALSKAAIVSPEISGKIVIETPILSAKAATKQVFKDYPKIQIGFRFAGRAGKVPLAEGSEEFLQQVGQNTAKQTHDLFDSDKNKGLGTFLTSALNETWDMLGTREGWDNFTAGFLTGFGIKGFTSLTNKITGKSGAEKDLIKRGVDEITESNSRYVNALRQLAHLEAGQEAINKNDIKTTKDHTRDAEISLFNTLSEFGVVEEYLDELGYTIKQMSESEQKDLLQDRTVDDVVSSVKERFYAYDDLYKRASKQIGNPYKEGTAEHRTWDAAIRVASSFEVYSKDAFDRAKTLQDEISEKYPIDASVVSAAFDPTILPAEVRDLQDYINKREESLKIEGLSKEERSKRREEINKEKQKLKILEKLQSVYYDENGKLKEEGKKERQTSETVSAILKGFYGNASAAPAELKQALTDMMELENDAYEYRNLYNLLSNKELFDHFGKAYVKSYLDKINQIQAKVTKAIENPDIEPTDEKYDEEKFNEVLEEVEGQGDARNQISQINDKINEGKITRNADGKLRYKEKDYTEQELFNKLLEEQNAPKDLLKKPAKIGLIKEVLNKRFNDLISKVQQTAQEKLETNVVVEDEKKGDKIDNQKPKSKNYSESKRHDFNPKGSATILHYFDKVIASIWRSGSPFGNIRDYLLDINDKETWEKINEARKELGGSARLTTISLITNDYLFAGRPSMEELNKSEDIRIIHDGIRHYVVTKGKDASGIIRNRLGLQIEDADGFVLVRDKDGKDITSPFRADPNNNFSEINDIAIHNVKRGDKLQLEVTQGTWNEALLDEKDDQKTANKLHISVKHKGVVVGVLRAADFLFETKNNRAIKDFRNNLLEKLKAGEIVQGMPLGEITMTSPTTSRNRNWKGGEIDWVNLSEFNPEDFKKTFYYIGEDGIMRDDSGTEIKDTDAIHDRRNFRKGGIYMKIEKPNGVNHTIQLYRSDKPNNEAPTFTAEEFIKGVHREVGQTDLNPQNPILSKRLIINLRVNEEISETENVNEELQKQFDDIVGETKLPKEFTKEGGNKIVDENGNPIIVYHGTNEQFESFSKDKLGSKNFLAESASEGFFFAGNKETSEAYIGINSADVMGMNIGGNKNLTIVNEQFKKEEKEIVDRMQQIRNEELAKADEQFEKSEVWKHLGGENLSPDQIQRLKYIDVKWLEFQERAEKRMEEEGLIEKQKELNKRKLEVLEELHFKDKGLKRRIISANLSMKNPYVFDYDGKEGTTEGLTSHIKKAKKAGNDGVIFKNLADGSEKDTIYVVFDPSQINIEDTNILDKLVIVTDINGNQKPLTNATREGNIIKHSEGEVSLNDIENISEVVIDPLTTQLEQSEQWEQIKNSPQEEIEKWIIEKGEMGIKYPLIDGTTIQIIDKIDGNTHLAVEKNGFVSYTGFDKNGKRLKDTSKVEPKVEGAIEGTVEGATEVKTTQEKIEENKPLIEAAIIKKLAVTLNAFNVDANSIFNKLQRAYNESVVSGQPIVSLTELTEKANLTQQETDAYDYVVNPLWYSDVWNFITQSEGIYDQIANEKWQKFRSDIAADLNSLEQVSSKDEYDLAVEGIMKTFDKGISVDLPDLLFMAFDEVREWISAIRQAISFDNIKDGFDALQRNVGVLGLQAKAGYLLTVNKVDRKSLGRNPIKSFSFNDVYMDLTMSSFGGKTYVKNEADNYYVEIQPNKRKTDKNIAAFQKNVESLIGITLPLQMLSGYLQINLDFSKLKGRVLQEKVRQQPQNFGKTIITNKQIKIKNNHYKIITSTVKADVVELENGDTYFNLLPLENNDTLYLKADQNLTGQQFRNISKEYLAVRNVPKKLSNIGQRIEKIRGLQSKIDLLKSCS